MNYSKEFKKKIKNKIKNIWELEGN